MYLGNHWTMQAMQAVIIVGALLALSTVVPAWRMDDKKALGQESEAVHLQEDEAGDEKDDDLAERIHGKPTCFGMLTGSSVIYVMFAGNLVVSLGAGMTIKFFPVFFQSELKVDPASLQVVFASLSGLTVVGTLLAERAARRWGRLQVVIPAYIIGVGSTATIGLLDSWGWTMTSVMLPLFTVRCTAMWSVSALQGSIVADYTPKATRGRWKALNSVTSLGWSGSAAVGGWLIDSYGYDVCFILTACFQGIAIPLFCLLLPHVAKESDLREKAGMAVDGKGTPLLQSPGSPLRGRSGSRSGSPFVSPGGHSILDARAQAFVSPPSCKFSAPHHSDEREVLPR
jgi:MFS family permease